MENHKTPIQDEHAIKLAKAFGIAVEKIYKEWRVCGILDILNRPKLGWYFFMLVESGRILKNINSCPGGLKGV